MSHDYTIFSLLNLVESVDEITTSVAVARLIGKREMSARNREIMARIEGLLKHASSEFAKLMNSCRPINRVPPEILTLIFSFVGRGGSVFSVSQVCKWWRRVAISSPILWTLYTSFTRFPHLDMVLQRSGNHLLDVHAHALDEQTIQCLLPLRSQIGRMQTFSAIFRSSQYASVATSLVEMFSSTATHLTQLSLSSAKRRGDVPSEGADSLFASLFGGAMPRLRILYLKRIRIWPQLCGSNLQCLVLVKTTLPILDLLSALKALPCLEVLALDSVSFSSVLNPPKDVIMMEYLRVLRIKMTTETENDFALLCHFLSSLAMQAGISVHLDVCNRSPAVQRTHPLDTARSRNYSIDGMHSLCLDREITLSDDMSFFKYEPMLPCRDFQVIPNYGIAFGWFYCRLMHVTRLMLHMREIAKLEYDLDWRTILGSVPSLESLIVMSYGTVSRDTDVFNILLEVDPITGIPRYALRLSEMVIILNFHRQLDLPLIHELIPFVKTRCASGYPIKQLQLITSHSAPIDIEEIKKYVHQLFITPNDGWTNDWMKLQIPRHLVKVEPDNIYSEHFADF